MGRPPVGEWVIVGLGEPLLHIASEGPKQDFAVGGVVARNEPGVVHNSVLHHFEWPEEPQGTPEKVVVSTAAVAVADSAESYSEFVAVGRLDSGFGDFVARVADYSE